MNPHDITTNSRLSITFDDETGAILISSPFGNKVEINDQTKSINLRDRHGNLITMNEEGISISSYKDVLIKGSNISLEAEQNIHVKAGINLESSAMNITEAAAMAFVAKGSSTAELSASGQTMVKGAMVMIN